MGVKEECLHGYSECDNYPYCGNTEGCLEVVDYNEFRYKRDSCPLASGTETCHGCGGKGWVAVPETKVPSPEELAQWE